MRKPTRTAKQLHQLLIERIEAISNLQGQKTDVHRGGVVWDEPWEDGDPNWTVRIMIERATPRHAPTSRRSFGRCKCSLTWRAELCGVG